MSLGLVSIENSTSLLISILLLQTGDFVRNNKESLRKTFPSIMYMEDISMENQLASLKQKIEKFIDEQRK